MNSDSNIVIQKLDEFIRRYYKNQLIKGIIYSFGILLSAFFTVTILEYLGEFNMVIRAFLFFAFIAAVVLVLYNYIAVPLLKLNKIGNIISYNEAANIIGKHFSMVKDKLLNLIQLQNKQGLTDSAELLLASIHQKTIELTPVPFSMAVDLNENKKYLKYVLPLFFGATVILIFWPQLITKSTKRLVNYQTYYEKEMPFKFNIQNKNLTTLQTEDFKLEVDMVGNSVPNEVFIEINGIEYKLEKSTSSSFHYIFSNVQKSTSFQLSAAGFLSKEYELIVLPKPSLLQFNLQLIYPNYLNKANENISNTGDLQIPQGTKIKWIFNTKNTSDLFLRFSDSSATPQKNGENQFVYSRKFLKSNNYSIKVLNKFVLKALDSVNYSIHVILDQSPLIDVNEKRDSLEPKNIYFSGQIKDDYGFSRLTFHSKKIATDSIGLVTETNASVPIKFLNSNSSQAYFYFLDAKAFNLNPGDKIEYYFEVFDNDGVNGPKAAKTQVMIFKAPTTEEINQSSEKNNSEIKKDLEESIQKAKQLQKDVNELAKKINEKKQLGYEEKKNIEELIKKQQALQNKINEVKQQNEQNIKQQNEFTKTDESIMEKQKQLEQLFENVMTPEMKKLFDELNKMLEQLDKTQVQEKLEELKLTNKDIEKELDRNLEAFKQLEVQQKMQNAIEKLEDLKNKQDALKKETEDKKDNQNNPDSKELEKKQNDIKKEFDELKKDLKDIEEKNKVLEEPNALPKLEEKQNEITKEMQKSSSQLSENKKKQSSEAQKSASEKMEEMKEEMEQSMEETEENQQEENAQTLRQILENLVKLSFSQEELIQTLSVTRMDNPQYIDIPKKQNKLKEDSKMIEDSLLALSKRAPQISAVVNREISAIHLNIEKSVKALAERDIESSSMGMQYTMASVNNLALLLNEALDQMQQQMKAQKKNKGKPGKGKCKKPGNGQNPSSSGKQTQNVKKMQEQLNKQLQQLKDVLEKGKKPGEKPGDQKGKNHANGMGQNGKSGASMPGSSEQFAKMAAQQEALRRQMQSMMEKLKNKGNNPGGDIANLMEETEKDLVNKRITSETMRRQEEILTRLLESEKAEQEREEDEQRKSNESNQQNLSNPSQFLEYKRLKEKEMEMLNSVPPSLTPYYKEKVNSYFNNINSPN